MNFGTSPLPQHPSWKQAWLRVPDPHVSLKHHFLWEHVTGKCVLCASCIMLSLDLWLLFAFVFPPSYGVHLGDGYMYYSPEVSSLSTVSASPQITLSAAAATMASSD